ncbi:alpha/beta fold hydrolase [Granulosicoccus antarcticus]|uniref:Esterase YbfF n=1 Tax=Granulosicoccus antarcticus IMCC3135 TaxID=1192854 RepID=A0A2Z2NX53_9GAMM|nr:alpha/beta fold hydrolase [Granulosicoccus antarcticus]ASJ75035.1 Esterase YbfF [Granulosicoccus antarcticus IMCC3135]
MSGLNSQQAGQGPVFIMLHGLFGSLDNFRSVSLHLERSLTVLRMDLPGHGLSPSLPTLSIEAMADAVLAEIDQLGIKEFHLLGHSLGGKVAMSVAGNPSCQGLQSLCVVDIAPRQYKPHHQPIIDALQALDLQQITDRRDADLQLRNAIPDAGVRAFLLKSLYRHDSGHFDWRFDLQQLATDYPLICRPPIVNRTIEPPTLFIKGGDSDYLGADDETGIKAVCAHPSLKIIVGAGHWPHAEKPAQFTRICQEFLSHV